MSIVSTDTRPCLIRGYRKLTKHKTQQQHQQCLFDANIQLVSDNFNVSLKTPSLSLFP